MIAGAFDKDDCILGLLHPSPIAGAWYLSFYRTEKGRNQGVRNIQATQPLAPLYKFKMTLDEIQSRGELVPYIAGDKNKGMSNVLKVDMRHKGGRRPPWRNN